MRPLVGLTTTELQQLAVERGVPAYRGKQIAQWIYGRSCASYDQMSDLPASFRAQLAKDYSVGCSTIAHCDSAQDGTRKYLLALQDGERVETVYLPYSDRVSVCLSTQVGCAAGCTFCATGHAGFARHMSAGEIVDQVLTLQRDNPDRRISHVVYMGMGEPMLNYDAVVQSIRLLTQEVGMSARNITVSTVGVAPCIIRLAEEQLAVTLAISLHAPDDDVRETLIPMARKWRIEQILEACRHYRAKTGRNLTFEYLMLADINDSPEQAERLAQLLEGLPGNVNLIPFNHVDNERGYRRPTRERITQFRAVLEAAGRVTTQRMSRGHAISAACGQLRRAVTQVTP